MKKAIINPQKCSNCTMCGIKNNCPHNAVIREEASKPWVDSFRCSGCMLCKNFCSGNSVEQI